MFIFAERALKPFVRLSGGQAAFLNQGPKNSVV